MPVKVDLSIIILSYNTKDLIKQCLESIKVQKGLHFETIVVDNASTDGSQEMIRKDFPAVRLICNKENIGFAGGNNVGIKEAKGSYILFLNSDTKLLHTLSLKNAFDFMQKNRECGALSAKTMLTSGKMDPDCHRGFPSPGASITYFLGLEKLFPKSKLFGQYHKNYLDLETDHEIDAGAGAFMMIKREITQKVGVWDESYFFYGEDLDYFYRIKTAGYKVMFYSKPLLIHYKGASSGLRKESQKISQNSKENRIRVAKASVKAMEIFYQKFYKDQYSPFITFIVLTGIKIKGFFRLLGHYLK